jgi:hypothetical protein
VNIRPISVAEMREHAGPLLRAHWDEVAKLRHLMVLDPNWELYEAVEERGNLLAMAAHDDDGRMMGYSVSFLQYHAHYAGLRYAQNDVLFVAPEARDTRLGLRLIQATEAEAVQQAMPGVLSHGAADVHGLPGVRARVGGGCRRGGQGGGRGAGDCGGGFDPGARGQRETPGDGIALSLHATRVGKDTWRHTS